MKALTKTDFQFEGQKSVYHGKVRDVYNINDDLMVMVATDRISAFDVILPKGIPYKAPENPETFKDYLDKWVYSIKDNDDLLNKIGGARLAALRVVPGLGYSVSK